MLRLLYLLYSQFYKSPDIIKKFILYLVLFIIYYTTINKLIIN